MRTLLQLGAISGLLAVLLVPLAAAAAATADGGKTLGKLFYSPAERRQLEARMQGLPPPGAEPAQARPMQAEVLHYNGMARRDGGAPMVWINGTRATQPVQLDGQTLVVPDSGQRLRPGQNSAAPGPVLKR